MICFSVTGVFKESKCRIFLSERFGGFLSLGRGSYQTLPNTPSCSFFLLFSSLLFHYFPHVVFHPHLFELHSSGIPAVEFDCSHFKPYFLLTLYFPHLPKAVNNSHSLCSWEIEIKWSNSSRELVCIKGEPTVDN